MIHYYKTDASVRLDTWAALKEARKNLQDQADVIADRFGGKAVLMSNMHKFYMAGIRFKPSRDISLWTTPTSRDGNVQRPRAAPRKGASKETRAESKQLRAQWSEIKWPESASMELVYESLGTNWANLLFSSLEMFEHEGFIYVATSAKLSPDMIEIFGSEFFLAKEQK